MSALHWLIESPAHFAGGPIAFLCWAIVAWMGWELLLDPELEYGRFLTAVALIAVTPILFLLSIGSVIHQMCRRRWAM